MVAEPAAEPVTLPSAERLPALGQGTWHFAEDPRRRASEVGALRLGLDLGMTLIDTAEMYGNGAAEELVGEAIAWRRDEVFLVSKVLPHHATRRGVLDACHASLRRLRTDRLDLSLLHWRGGVPLTETVDAFEELGATPAQVALAWVLRQPGVCAVPRAGTAQVRENRAALDLQLGPDELAALDRAFPPPASKVPLEVL